MPSPFENSPGILATLLGGRKKDDFNQWLDELDLAKMEQSGFTPLGGSSSLPSPDPRFGGLSTHSLNRFRPLGKY